MKTKTTLFILSFALSLLLFSCTENEDPAPVFCSGEEEELLACAEVENFYANFICDPVPTWDSLSLSEELMGEWKWEYVSCGWFAEPDCTLPLKESIEFKADQTVALKENGTTVRTLPWTLIGNSEFGFRLETEPMDNKFYGSILLCEGVLGFSNKPTDGCDNFFRKVN